MLDNLTTVPPLRRLTDEEIASYQRDGIVCVRQAFDAAWVEELRDLVAQDMAQPSGMVKDINAKGASGFFFGDTFVCHHIQGFKKAAFDGPGAALAGQAMGASKVNLLFDQILVKEPNTSTPTLWHHDAPYWPVAGDHVCTLWLALDPVTRDSGAVEYVKGSHRWGQRFKAVSFDPNQLYEEELPPVPDIDGNRDEYDIVYFDLAPGDITLHHGLTLHGAPPNGRADQRRRAYIQRFTGDDVTYNPRPNLQKMLRDPAIEPGGPLDCDLFPVVWKS